MLHARLLMLYGMVCSLLILAPLSSAADSAVITPARVTEAQFFSTSGESLSLASFKGSLVLLHFVASWCGECLLEAPSLATLAQSYRKRDLVVIAVAIDDTPADAKSFADKLMLPFPVLIDAGDALKQAFRVQGLPMTVLLDQAGQQVSFDDPATGTSTRRVTGRRDWISPGARASIEKLLSS